MSPGDATPVCKELDSVPTRASANIPPASSSKVLDPQLKREIDMNIRKHFEQVAAALIYAMALLILGGGVSLMCLPITGPVA